MAYITNSNQFILPKTAEGMPKWVVLGSQTADGALSGFTKSAFDPVWSTGYPVITHIHFSIDGVGTGDGKSIYLYHRLAAPGGYLAYGLTDAQKRLTMHINTCLPVSDVITSYAGGLPILYCNTTATDIVTMMVCGYIVPIYDDYDRPQSVTLDGIRSIRRVK